MEDAMHRIDLLVSSQSLMRMPHKARLTLLRGVLLPAKTHSSKWANKAARSKN